MAICPEKHGFTRQVYLWMMACVYLFAFASLYTQIPGLYGPSGLQPVHNVLPKQSGSNNFIKIYKEDNLQFVNQISGDKPLLERLLSFPSVLIFHDDLQLLPHSVMELCCVAGALLALLMMIFRAMRCSLMFFLLWALYFSVYKVGQVFLWFQWDSLLLEAGFITILVAPFNLLFWKKPVSSSHDGMTLWLVRWLLFRLMFASGIVKLTSNCPTWWGLTALNFHYETQCIPSPLSWYAHQLPDWFQKMGVVGTYFIEVAVPLLFFVPVRSLRIFAFWSQVLLQVLIILTGNYNFFNITTIALCFSLVDDDFFMQNASTKQQPPSPPSTSRRICQVLFGSLGDTIYTLVRLLMFLSVGGYMVALTVYYFDIQVDLDNWTIASNTRFNFESFESALTTMVPLLAVMGALSLAVEIVSAILSSLKQPGLFGKVFSLLQTGVFGTVVTVMFAISLVSHGVLDRTFYHSVPPSVMKVHNTLDQYSITNPYGLFRRMTGVGGRPELILEGSNDENGQWKEYDFLYKPGNIATPPVYVAPHQPRLDWQMWFAALGSYQHNPWMVHLVYRMLIGQKEVLQLMAPSPFEHPPRFIRARLFHYHYTPYNLQSSLFNQTKAWWYREVKREYLFPVTWDKPGLEDYLNEHKFLIEPVDSYPPTPLLTLLQRMRVYTDQFSPPFILWSLFFTAAIATATMHLLFPDERGGKLKPFEGSVIPKGTILTGDTETEAGIRQRHFSGTRKPRSA